VSIRYRYVITGAIVLILHGTARLTAGVDLPPSAAPPGCPAGPLGLVGCCRDAPRMVSRYDVPCRAVAKRRHLHGIAIVGLIIDARGNVCAARILKGLDAEFDRAALAAIKFWRFRPAMNYSGRPVMAAFSITVKAQ
jgi:protein TonB